MSKLTTFLSLLGRIALPLLAAKIPHGELIAAPIIDAMARAEAHPNLHSGIEKKVFVMHVAEDAVLAANAAGVHLPVMETLDAASNGIDTVVDTIHLIQGTKVAVDPPQPVGM